MNIIKPWFLLILSITLIGIISFFTITIDQNCYYIKINGLEFNNAADTVTIGKESNVIFNSEYIDSSFVKIGYSKDGFHWESKEPAYIKFNDTINFNKHILLDGDVIKFKNYPLLVCRDLKKRLESYPDQNYFYVSDFFETKNKNNDKDYLSEKPRSLIFYKAGKLQAVLLDTLTTLIRAEKKITAVKSGRISSNTLKVEIINPQSNFFIKEKNPLYRNRNIIVPTVRTEWQSRHLLFIYDDERNSMKVDFSQPLVVALNKKIIEEITKKTVSMTMLVAQESPLMDKKTFYFEKCSNLFTMPIFCIQSDDKANSKDTISFNTILPGQRKIIISNKNLNSSFDFKILSQSNRKVSLCGSFIYMNSFHFLLPFILLTLIFIISVILLWFFTREEQGIYSSKIYHTDSESYIDFENIQDIKGTNKTFFLLRLPVLILIYILMICKLVIVTKLTFTHPFFPELYFIGCFMAFTTPVFITYFFIRNSWSIFSIPKAYIIKEIPNPILFTLGLFICVYLLYQTTWLIIGEKFYASFFESYGNNIKDAFSGITYYMRNITHDNSQSILTQKFYQIPITILVIPLALLIIDIIMFLVKKLFNFSFSLLPKWLSETARSLDVLILLTFGFAMTKSATLFHLIVMVLFFMFFRWVSKSEKKVLNLRYIWSSILSFIQPFGWRAIVNCFAFVIILIVFILKFLPDIGIIINYFLVTPFAIFLFFILLFSTDFENHKLTWLRNWILPLLPMMSVILLIYGIYNLNAPKIDDLGRTSRRINSIISKDAALATGGKQYLSDIQFLEIAQINCYEDIKKPSFKLMNREKPFHEFISKGLYPVIINDLNPIVFLDYGGWLLLAILVFSWIFFFINRYMIWNADFNLNPDVFDLDIFNFGQLLRYIPALIIIGNSLWLFLSLLNVVFFTGRIINGFGMDSISEWFELIVFSVLMGMVIFGRRKNNKQ